MAAPVIEVEHLHKRHGGKVAVEDIGFSAGPGAILAIVGPNGAGKTTTVECIEGLRRPDRGRVRVLGLDPARDRRRLYERVGVLLQSDNLPRRQRIIEAFEVHAGLYDAPAQVAEILDACRLRGKERAFYGTLSGGQKRLAGIGLALLGNPEVLLLDEPTTGLDPRARRDVWQLLRDRRDRGATILLTTHSIEEAEALCDTLCMIDRGRVIALGSPRDLLEAQRRASLLDLYLFMTDPESRGEDGE
jgi:ABC-2 type transport system ATP-binding protein